MRLLRRAAIGGAVAWAAALPLATAAAAQAHSAAWTSVFALAVYAVGSVVCHQIDARSFHLWSHQMPVCARCAGIYAGAAVGALAAAMIERRRSVGASTPPLHPRWLIGLAAAPLAATLVFEWTTGLTPSNLLRAATGVVLGTAVGWVIVRGTSERAARTTL